MSRVHEPTIATEARLQRRTIRDLDLDVPDVPFLDQRGHYIAALRTRIEENRETVDAIGQRMSQYGPSASLIRARVSLELEIVECRRALSTAGVTEEETE